VFKQKYVAAKIKDQCFRLVQKEDSSNRIIISVFSNWMEGAPFTLNFPLIERLKNTSLVNVTNLEGNVHKSINYWVIIIVNSICKHKNILILLMI
jgi:hypothetical protein